MQKYVSFSAFFTILFTACAHSPTPPSVAPNTRHPFLGDSQVERFVFPNGLKLLVLENHSAPTVAYQTWFNVGSRNEIPNYTGLAHLFEHLMFKATKKHPEGEFSSLLERAGSRELNAFTTRDATAYVQEIPKSELELLMQLESDRMVNLIVDDKTFQTEREVVKNERKFRTDNSPEGRMNEALYENAYATHPYRWPVIGYEADLERMQAKEARDFYLKFYGPASATIVVVGDVQPKAIRDLVEKYYGSILRNPRTDPIIPNDPPPVQIRRKKVPIPSQVEKIQIAYRVPPADSPDSPAIEVFQAVLTTGNSSRLRRKLIDTGIASEIDSGSFLHQDPGLYVFFSTAQKGRPPSAIEDAIVGEIEKIASSGVSATELERAINQSEFALYSRMTNNMALANLLGSYESRLGDYEKGLRIFLNIPRVTAAQIRSVAKKYFQPNSRIVIEGIVQK